MEYLGLCPAYTHYTAAFLVHTIQLVVIGLVIIRKYHLSWTAFGFRRPTRKDWLQLLPWALITNLISLLVLWLTFTFLWTVFVTGSVFALFYEKRGNNIR
ncbi:hypothetical protein [Paenibacillus thiaminolyticus]|uniref:Uncharacterized protein n=1 Tax=Paenibacillus thiaminolyticus TaxID=49283 RepID=A0A3A3GC98_PANTH|nr:hypothetical protein [Paenibacillus thiaminolyticus]RJG18870.1 hypothetical protein DQX05_26830 [Paenibacillus thiaminolyticus]